MKIENTNKSTCKLAYSLATHNKYCREPKSPCMTKKLKFPQLLRDAGTKTRYALRCTEYTTTKTSWRVC